MALQLIEFMDVPLHVLSPNLKVLTQQVGGKAQ